MKITGTTGGIAKALYNLVLNLTFSRIEWGVLGRENGHGRLANVVCLFHFPFAEWTHPKIETNSIIGEAR